MTKYRVRLSWWEGLVEADEMAPCSEGRSEVNFWCETDTPEGSELVGVITETLVAVDQEHLVEDVMLNTFFDAAVLETGQ